VPARKQNGIAFVSRVPAAGGSDVNVIVEPMTRTHVRRWQREVQPEIDTDPGRVDFKWNWNIIWGVFRPLNPPTRRVEGYLLRLLGGTRAPCAMVLVDHPYPALQNPRLDSVLLWYLSTAPRAYLEQNTGNTRCPRMIGSAALDVAISCSYSERFKGLIGLHADPKGRRALLNWYSGKGMIRLPKNTRLSGIRRLSGNDGRYFYHDAVSALAASQSLDMWR